LERGRGKKSHLYGFIHLHKGRHGFPCARGNAGKKKKNIVAAEGGRGKGGGVFVVLNPIAGTGINTGREVEGSARNVEKRG